MADPNATASPTPPSIAGREGDVTYTADGTRWAYRTGMLGLGGGWVIEGSPAQAPSTTIGATTPGGTPSGAYPYPQQAAQGQAAEGGATTNATAQPAAQPMSSDDWLVQSESELQKAMARLNDPNTGYNQQLQTATAAQQKAVEAGDQPAAEAAAAMARTAQDAYNSDRQLVATLGTQVSQERTRRTELAKANHGLTAKEVAEIDARTEQYRIAAHVSELQVQQEQIKLDLAKDPTNTALAQEAARLDNEGKRWDTYGKQWDVWQKNLESQYGPANQQANLDKLNLANQNATLVNQWYGPTAAASVNSSQAATYASLQQAAAAQETLRRAKQGDIESYAQDLDTAVKAGRMSETEAVQRLQDKLDGVTQWDRQKLAGDTASALTQTAMQQGEYMSPAQAAQGSAFYGNMAREFGGGGAGNVPSAGVAPLAAVQSLGIDTSNPYQDARQQQAAAAAGSLGLGNDWRGMDPAAVIRAVKSYAAGGGQASQPQQPSGMPTAPDLLPVAAPAGGSYTPTPAQPAPAAPIAPAAASSLVAPAATPNQRPAGYDPNRQRGANPTRRGGGARAN